MTFLQISYGACYKNYLLCEQWKHWCDCPRHFSSTSSWLQPADHYQLYSQKCIMESLQNDYMHIVQKIKWLQPYTRWNRFTLVKHAV